MIKLTTKTVTGTGSALVNAATASKLVADDYVSSGMHPLGAEGEYYAAKLIDGVIDGAGKYTEHMWSGTLFRTLYTFEYAGAGA